MEELKIDYKLVFKKTLHTYIIDRVSRDKKTFMIDSKWYHINKELTTPDVASFHSKRYLWDHFYTMKEERKLKLKQLDEIESR